MVDCPLEAVPRDGRVPVKELLVTDTERSRFQDMHWHRREDKPRRQRWQRRHRQAVRMAVAAQDWDGADRRWRRTSGWLTH